MDQLAASGALLPPRSDPTFLTTEQLMREVGNLRVILEAEIKAETDLTEVRFKAVAQVSQCSRETVDKEFQMLEKQRLEQKQDVKAAVDAALASQKEAVKEQTIASERSIAKSEAATAKQMEQIIATFTASIGALSQQIGDLKDRMGKVELQAAANLAAVSGTAKGKTDSYGNIVTIVMLGAVVITMILKFFVGT